eukprot:g4229.t1
MSDDKHEASAPVARGADSWVARAWRTLSDAGLEEDRPELFVPGDPHRSPMLARVKVASGCGCRPGAPCIPDLALTSPVRGAGRTAAAKRRASGTAQTKVRISSVCCAAQVPQVDRIITTMPGVKKLVVNLVTRTAYIDHDVSVVSPQAIVEKLENYKWKPCLLPCGACGGVHSCEDECTAESKVCDDGGSTAKGKGRSQQSAGGGSCGGGSSGGGGCGGGGGGGGCGGGGGGGGGSGGSGGSGGGGGGSG